MRILFDLGHPAHFHLFKYIASRLRESGIEINFSIQKKDILEELVKESSFDYENILPNGRKSTRIGLVVALVQRFKNILNYCLRIKPDLLIGTSLEISYIGKILNIPSLNLNEDDAKVVSLYSRLAYPFATEIITPISCDNGKWDKRSIKYNSYQELAYLHPNYFSPNEQFVTKYNLKRPYFILRFSKLSAHHDFGVKGINETLAYNIIDKLGSFGTVYISSEKELGGKLNSYILNIEPKDMHHILYFADLLISDSQTMSAEAAVLGTPSIRFNDFVGKLGYLEELEQMYELTYGIKSNEPEKLLQIIDELRSIRDIQAVWQNRRKKMLTEKIDLTDFMVRFVKNYLLSIKTDSNIKDFNESK